MTILLNIYMNLHITYMPIHCHISAKYYVNQRKNQTKFILQHSMNRNLHKQMSVMSIISTAGYLILYITYRTIYWSQTSNIFITDSSLVKACGAAVTGSWWLCQYVCSVEHFTSLLYSLLTVFYHLHNNVAYTCLMQTVIFWLLCFMLGLFLPVSL